MNNIFGIYALLMATATMTSCQSADPRPMVDEIVAEGAVRVVGDDLRAVHADRTHYGTYTETDTHWVLVNRIHIFMRGRL